MTTDTLSQHTIKKSVDHTQAERNGKQYSQSQILWIWALASIPGGLLFWLGLPFLDTYTEISVGYLVLIVLVVPYFWHYLLAIRILKKEGVGLDWNTIKDRLWLRTTTDPRTGKRNNAIVCPVSPGKALALAKPHFV